MLQQVHEVLCAALHTTAAHPAYWALPSRESNAAETGGVAIGKLEDLQWGGLPASGLLAVIGPLRAGRPLQAGGHLSGHPPHLSPVSGHVRRTRTQFELCSWIRGQYTPCKKALQQSLDSTALQVEADAIRTLYKTRRTSSERCYRLMTARDPQSHKKNSVPSFGNLGLSPPSQCPRASSVHRAADV